jgi:N,N'-diacetyllegionaminate synthase
MNKRVYIIAEAGVNHNGDINLAKKMIEIAAQSGVNAVKFQSFKTDSLITHDAIKAEYQVETTASNETQYQMLKKLELDIESHHVLIDHCKKNNIEFLSSPFDLESIDLLTLLGLQTYKIPSGEINNVPYLRKIASLNKKTIISTGMSNLGEIEFALNLLVTNGTSKDKISVLHCNTEYPTPFDDVNLNAMLTIKQAFQLEVGYSDHTPGIEIPVAAVALGAKIIEKHFTLDKTMEGPDHRASLDRAELNAMVKAIRNVEKALGSFIKQPSPSELKNIVIVRKSIIASCNIKKGETFTVNNITVKRPSHGISPLFWDKVLGKTANRDFNEGELIIL